MINLVRSKTHRCILQKNVSSDRIIEAYLNVISKSKAGVNYGEVKKALKQNNIYKGRSDEGSLSTMGVRFSQMCFYMFGYKVGKIFFPSPMTENLLNPLSKISKESNTLVNLFSLQFPHPFSKGTPSCFNLYFGRLFVKLLLDERIEKKLYIDEIIWFLPFVDKINFEIYEELIQSILEYRNLSYYEKVNMFHNIEDYEEFMATTLHEFKYYFLKIFKSFGVLDLIADNTHNDGKLIKFIHPGDSKTLRTDVIDGADCSGFARLNSKIFNDAKKLDSMFSAFDIPTSMKTEGIFSKQDLFTALYDTEPLDYLNAISTTMDREREISRVIQNMIHASKYGSRDGKDFENALKPFMELFEETCDVTIISGAGDTDLLCSMEDENNDFYKMNVDAKTRKAGLEEINAVRLERHLEKNGSLFCIVVAPRFASGITGDISGHKVVTIRAEDFGTYCYKECKNNPNGFADFESIHKIIDSNLGTDITNLVRNLTKSRYGITL